MEYYDNSMRFGSLEHYKYKFGLEDNDIQKIREQIHGYRARNLLYRIKNAVLSIFCQSDWQKAARFIANKFIEKNMKIEYEQVSVHEKMQRYFNAYKNADHILKCEITPDCLIDAPFFSPFSYSEWVALQG